MDSQVVAIQIWPLRIPLRRPFRHAAAERRFADPIVVEVELADGTIGFGETLPRPYVTAETDATVQAAIRTVLLEPLVSARPQSLAEALDLAESLPWHDRDGQPCPAARAAVELALLDAYGKLFKRQISQMAGWFGTGGYGAPGSTRKVRFAAVLGAEDPHKLHRQIRLARLYGLRDFKLKLGDADPGLDWARLEAALAALRRPLAAGKVCLRVDANGAWQPDQAMQIMAKMRGLPITAVEQPTPAGTEDVWPELQAESGLAIWADESVCTLQDAQYLAQAGLADGLNVRISKCGGLTAAVRLAELSKQQYLTLMTGCMVGETAILSAALVQLLTIVDNAAYAEGCYGRLLLRRDVGRRVQFGYGGKVPRLKGFGLGVHVDRQALRKLCPDGPKRLAP